MTGDTDATAAASVLACSLCLFTRTEANAAVTVLNGQAVCEDHLGYVQGGDHFIALRTVRLQEGSL
jgi:hypothetical protein